MRLVRTGATPAKPTRNTQANDTLHLWLLIGVAAMALLGTSGVAVVLAWMPTSTALPVVVSVSATRQALPASPAGAEAQVPSARAAEDAPASVRCPECGVVESTREIVRPGEGIAPAAAGAVTRGDRNEITGHSSKSYEITVRMKDGSRQVFMDATRANWRPGERVMIIGSASLSNQ